MSRGQALGRVRKGRLDEVDAPLGGRVDHRALDLVQRALGERREGADRLDLVAEQLDAERLAAGRREHVDEPAADHELAALLDAVDALVAREREVLGKSVEAGRGPGSERERLGPRLRRRHRLGQRGRGGADEPARREHVERAGPLADEVRRRLEPGAPVDAAARQQRDPLLAEEPARSVGRVPRVRVFGKEHDERPPQVLVQRREQERQRGLGDPGRSGKRVRERAQPLVREELLDERMEDGSGGVGQVHDERRNARFRPLIVLAG